MAMYSLTSCSTKAKWGSREAAARFSAEPVTKLSAPITSQPRPRRNSVRCEPMKPAAPVTRTRIRGVPALGRHDGLATDRVVLEPEPSHSFGFPQVAPVDDEGAAHHPAQPFQVEELELVPLGDEAHRVGPGGCLVRRIAEPSLPRQHRAGVGRGH